LNNESSCKSCYEVKKSTDKHGNREIAKFLYECRLNAITIFDGFHLIEYLAKSGFGEVVSERIHNSNDKIVDILKEAKQKFIVIITITGNFVVY